jgi:hypothetical protein
MIEDLTTSPQLVLLAHLFMVIIPLIVPVFPIILSCILSVYAMIKSINVTLQMSERNINGHSINEKKRITLTVIVMTLVYILFNLPPAVTVILYLVGYAYPKTLNLFEFDHRYYYYNNFQEIFCVGLNSAMNPLIYVIFMPTFRKYFFRFLKLTKLRHVQDVSESVNI